jgi:hypothetical protein
VPGTPGYSFDGLDNTGQSFYCLLPGLCFYSATADADIDAPEAWAISTGSSAVTVAVIDSGVDYNHPDLAANYAGGDDFVFSDGDPMDDHGHGTHVAGTIAAALGNLTGTPAEAEGVAGVAPNARILGYKVCRSDGTCDDFAIQQAIARAITDGANVINMSLGQTAYSQSLDDAVQDAWNAGLSSWRGWQQRHDGPFYPAALIMSSRSARSTRITAGLVLELWKLGRHLGPGQRRHVQLALAVRRLTTPGNTGCYVALR